MKTGAHSPGVQPLWRRVIRHAAMLSFFLAALHTFGEMAFYVNDASSGGDVWCTDVGDDEYDGLSPSTPMATIQAVITRYKPGQGTTIYVDAGTYMLTTDLVLPDTGPGQPSNGWFRLVGAEGQTVLDRQNVQTGTACLRIEQDFAWVSGIVFRRAQTGILIDPATCRNAILSNNVLTANSGYAVHVINDPAEAVGSDQYIICNTVIHNTGKGMNLQADSGTRLAAFTVEHNTISIYGSVGIALGGRSQGTVLRNNIITVKGSSGWCLIGVVANALTNSNYNNLWAISGAGVARWATNNTYFSAYTLADWQQATGFDTFSLSRDPLYVASASGDLHLRSAAGSWRGSAWVTDSMTSPCIDAGAPESVFDNEPYPNGGRVNMGAYGNTAQASKSAAARALSLLAPGGGTIVSGVVTIIWSASGSGWLATDKVRIEVAASSGTNWTVLAGATNLPSTGSFEWTPPNPASASAAYYIRVVCNQDSSIADALTSPVIIARTSAVYYVNDTSTAGDKYCTTAGSTNNSGKSPNQPVLSLNALLANVTLGPGDTVYWDAGTYTQTVIGAAHKGTRESPIRIMGAHNATRIVHTGSGTDRRSLDIRADHIRVSDLVCSSADIGIAVDAATARFVGLIGNTCSNNTLAGIEVKPRTSGSFAGGEFLLLQNVVINNGDTGIFLQAVMGSGTTDGKTVFIVENNTVYALTAGIRIFNATRVGRRANFLKNNIVETTASEGVCIVAPIDSFHYSDFNNLYPRGGGKIAAWEGGGTYDTLAAWRAASGQDKNSISADSQFVSSQTGNFRVNAASPCVDAGINSFWMFGAVDADGNPRIVGRSADIGAYELNLRASVRCFLQGPFLFGTEMMSTQLGLSGLIPLKSPYADDPRTVPSIPSNVTDWVLVQFRKTHDGAAVLSRSVFLGRDGWVVDDAGQPGFALSLPADGAYHVVVKHRNHLAGMSADPVPFNNQSLTYDFTGTNAAFFGGELACATVFVPNGTRYALCAGDVDGDGVVTPLDRDWALWSSQINAAGYRRGDAGLDGMVTSDDIPYIEVNSGKASAVPRAETWLMPALRVTPSRQTVQTNESVTLTGWASTDATRSGDGTSGVGSLSIGQAFHWGFAANASGATLTPADGVQAAYTAGAATGRTDIVQAWDDAGALGRSVLDVIGSQAAVAAGQAVVIAGRTSPGDTLWPATDYLADTAYATLRYRGFSKENIHYLSPELDQDVDGNGLLDDIDAESTFANAAAALTNSVVGAERLFVYLVDHGGTTSGNGYFRLNATDTITAVQLDEWLDALQDSSDIPVTVLLDFCYAGSFLLPLKYSGTATRIVIAACGEDEPSYFVSGGLVSFSGAFFSGVMLGYDVMDSFTMATNAMSTYQAGMMDDDKDGLGTTNDGMQATGTYIGPTYVTVGDAPSIGDVCGNQVLTEETSATLWIGSISSVHPITRAWCLIIPPGHDPDPDNPVTDLPTLELAYDIADGRYSVTYDGFTAAGTYNVTFYVQDEEGNVSLPRQAYIAQIGYDDRVVLVVGGDTSSEMWPALESLAELAYDTLRLRLFTPDRMCVLTPSGSHDFDGDGTNDVAGAATCANLQAAIGEWAVTNSTDRLTVYLLGEGLGNAFRINTSEIVTTNVFAGWIRDFQATNPVPVTLILDFSGAGAFLPGLADTSDSPDVDRVAIASSCPGREALFANGGIVSFSQYLLAGIISGETLGDAYTNARRAIRRVSGGVRQRAQLDDTRNGVPNEKNSDGLVAADTYLGSAFVTGADAPSIGSVMRPVVLATPGSDVTLWAGEVAGMYPISNVWCVVTPPDASPTDDLPTIALHWNGDTNRYEAVTNAFVLPGAYVLTFFARDTAGAVSAPLQSEVILADAYEPDDEAGSASLYYGALQVHTFLTAADVDWVRVYLVSNFIYEIETDHISETLDTVIDFYREGSDGTLELIDHVDDEGDALGEYTGEDFPVSGWYWVRLSPYSGGTNSVGAYTFSMEVPAADGLCNLIVLGVDDVYTAALPDGSTASVEGQGTHAFNGSKTVVFTGLTNGSYTVTVPVPEDFMSREDPAVPDQIQSLTNFYYANPRTVAVSGGWVMAGFEFFSTLAVTSGVVRDAWTGAFLGGAQISFTAASGSLTGSVVTGSVMFTSYSTHWISAESGEVPSNIVLGACDWDLSASLAGYEPYAWIGAVSNQSAGASLELGALYLVPTDTNGNDIADLWEDLYFPGGLDPDDDEDEDGLANRAEYQCGTDPTNALSVLRFLGMQVTTNGAHLTWSVVGGRNYQILSVTSLVDTVSIVTNGPWGVVYGQTDQEWIDTDAILDNTRFYRIRLDMP